MKKEGRYTVPVHKEIYNGHANQYELLVSREDYQHNTLHETSSFSARVCSS
jgi:hypothetical protein